METGVIGGTTPQIVVPLHRSVSLNEKDKNLLKLFSQKISISEAD